MYFLPHLLLPWSRFYWVREFRNIVTIYLDNRNRWQKYSDKNAICMRHRRHAFHTYGKWSRLLRPTWWNGFSLCTHANARNAAHVTCAKYSYHHSNSINSLHIFFCQYQFIRNLSSIFGQISTLTHTPNSDDAHISNAASIFFMSLFTINLHATVITAHINIWSVKAKRRTK